MNPDYLLNLEDKIKEDRLYNLSPRELRKQLMGNPCNESMPEVPPKIKIKNTLSRLKKALIKICI